MSEEQSGPASVGLRISATIEEPTPDGYTLVRVVTVCIQPEDLRAALVRLAEMETAKAREARAASIAAQLENQERAR